MINLSYSVNFTNIIHSMAQTVSKYLKEVCLSLNNILGDAGGNTLTKSHNHTTIDPSPLPQNLHEIHWNLSKSFKPPIYLESNPFSNKPLTILGSSPNLDSLLHTKSPLNGRYFSDMKSNPKQIQAKSVFSRKSSMNVTSSFYQPYSKSNNHSFEGSDLDYQMAKDNNPLNNNYPVMNNQAIRESLSKHGRRQYSILDQKKQITTSFLTKNGFDSRKFSHEVNQNLLCKR